MSNNTPVTSVSTLDLNRYLGLWYEIGRLPLRWEPNGNADVTAHYSLQPNGTLRVDNRCFDAEAKPVQALGVATPSVEEAGQLTVNFAPKILQWLPFTAGDYWVLKLAEDYSVALVGSPDQKNLWLLSRTPRLSETVEQEYRAEALRQGFDLTGWIRPVQTGGRVTDEILADD